MRAETKRARVNLRVAAAAIFAGGCASVATGVAQATAEHYGPAMNYRLHCEGCHKEDGTGQSGYIPSLRDSVARFLARPEGRAYLARVPGTAQSLLTDAERAELLNWIVREFDPEHVPSDFSPYQAAEIAQWRFDALSQPGVVRASLLAQLDPAPPLPAAGATGSATARPTTAGEAAPGKPAGQPPAAFSICAACHTVSPDGAPGIGPNLRGVVGRKPGSAPGFTYSPAMKDADFTWSRVALEEFLTSPGDKVPGNYMTFPGLPDPADRAAVIDYLESLR